MVLLSLAAFVCQIAGMPKRMFVAIDLPAQVAESLARLDPQLPGLRWLGASQLHLTLCFIAAVAEDLEARLIAELAAVCVPPFPLALKGLDCFARIRQPAVVWVGVESALPSLFRLQSQVRDAVFAAGLTPHKKPFRPHITVARCKGLADDALRPWLARYVRTGLGTFAVCGFTLYSSTLHPRGPEHLAVFRRDFGPA
ncbi:MAG: RNA 2',3'-cyclic phosphodiesterase [Verrucomicrobia bacterium]|nr:RNA 2',3'-cyclic phosphodiesterase [Verrucomicrobiota bacterium]